MLTTIVESYLPVVLTVLFGGGGVIAFLKLRGEKEIASATAGQIVQEQNLNFAQTAAILGEAAEGLVKPLSEKNDRLGERIAVLEAAQIVSEAKIEECVAIGVENVALRERVDVLESAILKKGDTLPNGGH